MRVVLIEDQRQTREELAALSGGSAAASRDSYRPWSAGQPSVDAVVSLSGSCPQVSLTVHYVLDALCAGPWGHLLKDG